MKGVIQEPSESEFYDMEQSHVVDDIEEEYVYYTDIHLDSKEEFELWRAIEESRMQMESEEQYQAFSCYWEIRFYAAKDVPIDLAVSEITEIFGEIPDEAYVRFSSGDSHWCQMYHYVKYSGD